MTLITRSGAPLSTVPDLSAAKQLCTQAPPSPRIEKVERSPHQDGVWHQINVSFRGEKSQRYQLELKWDAQTPKEDGQGTTNNKFQSVEADNQGNGLWGVEIKGYPAGKMRARVTDMAGAASEWSPEFDVPWIY